MSQLSSFDEIAMTAALNEPEVIPGLFILAVYFFLNFIYLGLIEAVGLIKFFWVHRRKAVSFSYLYTFVFFLAVTIFGLLLKIIVPEFIEYSLDVESVLIMGGLLLCCWVLLMGIFLRISDSLEFGNFSNHKIYGSQFVVFMVGSICSFITTWGLLQLMHFLI